MKLVKLDDYRNREVVAALKELTALAENGQLEGLVFIAKLGHADHRAGRAGCYKRHPEQALPAALMLKQYLAALGGAARFTA